MELAKRKNNFRNAIIYLKEELPKLEQLDSAILHGSARNLIEEGRIPSRFSYDSDIDLIVLARDGPKIPSALSDELSHLYKETCERFEIYDEYPGNNKLAKLDIVLVDDFTIKTNLFYTTEYFKQYLINQHVLFGENFAHLIWSEPRCVDAVERGEEHALAMAIRRLRRARTTLEFYYEHSELMFDYFCVDRAMECIKAFEYTTHPLRTSALLSCFKGERRKETKKLQVKLASSMLEERLWLLKN